MKKILYVLFLLILSGIICPVFGEDVTVNSTLCISMGETKVLVEMKNVKILQNAYYNRKGGVIQSEKKLIEQDGAQVVLVCDWYELYKDYTFSNPISMFFIKYLPDPNGSMQYHFDNLEYAIKYDSIKILKYEDFRGDFDRYGKKVQKSEVQKIYNPDCDTLILN
ncbi:MAG: hypothetical protein K5829_03110 [Treponema sp.]|nr:hypothetical protein [Treponema sp.]